MAHSDELYSADYVSTYLSDYHVHPFWRPKLKENQRQLAAAFSHVPQNGVWIDCCCGAAQHFGCARADLHCIGLDNSADQIHEARRQSHVTSHTFVLGNVSLLQKLGLPRADLITVFWGAFSYLSSPSEWDDVLQAVAGQIAPAGRLYMENPTVSALLSFNESSFAIATGFRVLSVQPSTRSGFYQWHYADRGGIHELLTPDFATLSAALAGVGLAAKRVSVVQTIEQITATRSDSFNC